MDQGKYFNDQNCPIGVVFVDEKNYETNIQKRQKQAINFLSPDKGFAKWQTLKK
jgi:hypothetical protein